MKGVISYPIMSERLPVELKFPVSALRETQLEQYRGNMYRPQLVSGVYKQLREQHGIEMPLNFDWERFLTEEVLQHAEPHVKGYSIIDQVNKMKIVDGMVCLDCIVINPDYNPNVRHF